MASAVQERRARVKSEKVLELLRGDLIDDAKQAPMIAELVSRLGSESNTGIMG